MSLRKAVFQAKVLQRLYPVSVKPEKVTSSPDQPPKAEKSSSVQLKSSKVTGGSAGGAGVSDKKVYTVLPPPGDYVPASGDGSAEAANPEAVNNADELPVCFSDDFGSDDHGAAEDEFPTRKRRKRKRGAKAASPTDCTPILSDVSGKTESTQGMSAARSPEHLSKNKKRKLKKKRHKEKLRALGLVPRSTALEFTYKQSQDNEREEEEEEEEGQILKVQEVLELLQSTWDIYLSESSGSAGDSSLPVAAVESLLIRLSDGSSPGTVVSSLCRLRSLLALREVEPLRAALDEFRCTSTLQRDETEVLCRLFHYWINEILPMQLEKKT